MPTVASLLAEVSPEAGQVQANSNTWVCDCCLGPVNPDFRFCYACDQLIKRGVPRPLLDMVVPISIAPRPGSWYNRLATYKAGHPEFRAHLAAMMWAFLDKHENELEALLGGPASAITPVPSKRGRTFEEQPLRQALSMVQPIREQLVHALTFVPAPDINWRRDYYPACFDPGAFSVAGERVILIEDTWVTGATALSAAGALLRGGAAGVAIVPIARVIDVSFWENQEHPYLAKIRGERRDPFTVEVWPRS